MSEESMDQQTPVESGRGDPARAVTTAEPSAAEIAALKKWEDDRLSALRRGAFVLHDLTNVAYGTPGFVIQSLWRDGLLDCTKLTRDAEGYVSTHYAINAAGLTALSKASQ